MGEEEGKIAVDLVVALKDTGSLDTFVGGGDLDENTGFVNTDGFVELTRLAHIFPGRDIFVCIKKYIPR
jgi:hypothetical protein